jgi:hypothetical protein
MDQKIRPWVNAAINFTENILVLTHQHYKRFGNIHSVTQHAHEVEMSYKISSRAFLHLKISPTAWSRNVGVRSPFDAASRLRKESSAAVLRKRHSSPDFAALRSRGLHRSSWDFPQYSRSNSTRSPAPGASYVSEPRLMSQVGRLREVMCA